MKSAAYEAVFNQIMEQMEKGVIPWRRPWKNCRPMNAKTGRFYNGINFFILSMSEFEENRWITFNQLKELGGSVKKGEKSRQVVFWQILSVEEDGNKKSIPFLKYFNVFNISQTEGVEWDTVKIEPNYDADAIVDSYTNKPEIKHGGDRACYIPASDQINMPVRSAFEDQKHYYCTLFHELVHSTGHPNRLNRKGVANVSNFGSANYSEEELIAEFGAAFLCNAAGIDNIMENSSSYIKGWMSAFTDNPSMIVSAASKAQKASDYILRIKTED
jgi:antirestriction protein ArdC